MRRLWIISFGLLVVIVAGAGIYGSKDSSVIASVPAIDLPDEAALTLDHKPVASALLTKQRHFDVEEDFDTPVPLPAEAWKLIVDAEDNSYFRDELVVNSDPAYWVEASKIDIDLNGHDDYIVMGRKIPLLGANVTRFYIILNSGEGKFYTALNISTKVLFISDERDRHGARKIDTVSLTAVEAFEREYIFDGKQYQFKSVKVSKLG